MPFAKGHLPIVSSFPTFLLPPPPFRRRHSDLQLDRTSSPVTDNPYGDTIVGDHVSYIQCARCATDICLTSQIISKGFTGRHGRAYLVSGESSSSAISTTSSSSPITSLPNTMTQRAVPRQLVTGAHTVCDISCVFCGSVLGWKYVAAEEESQRYKVGKYILETKRINTASCWELESHAGPSASISRDLHESPASPTLDTNVEFDSQDEDECEDLFAGVWSPGLALRRRKRKFEGHTAT
jgi:hypothetical protein